MRGSATGVLAPQRSRGTKPALEGVLRAAVGSGGGQAGSDSAAAAVQVIRGTFCLHLTIIPFR